MSAPTPRADIPCDECRAPSTHVDDRLPQYDPIYACPAHAVDNPRLDVHFRPLRPEDKYDKRGRQD